MQVLINIDSQPQMPPQQLEGIHCISTLVFTFIVDKLLEQKMKRILIYMPFLTKYPTVRTQLRVLKVESCPLKLYGTTALGGTFDYLHIGHQILLLYAVLSSSEKVIIGVTGAGMLVNKKNKELIQHISVRMKQVQKFVRSINPQLNYFIFQLGDPFGPTTSDQNIDCLVASPQTGSSIQRINEERQKKKLKPLDLVVCPLLSEKQDVACKLSSSGTRQHLLKKNSILLEQMGQYRQIFEKLTAKINEIYLQNQKKNQLAQTWWNQIYTSYSQHWRFYHTNEHIFSIFKAWNSAQFDKTRSELHPKQIIILQLALLFHDIVYVPSSKTNEKDSAQLAGRFIQQYFGSHGQKEQVKKTVYQLILETQHHIPSSKLSQIVYDLDMGVLNYEQKQYKVYARNVKKQYEPVVKDTYGEKRIQFLKKTLQDKLHFSFQPTNLQENIEWELNCLQNEDL